MTSAATAQSVRYREYETIYLMRPNVTKVDAARVAKRIEDVVERLGGKLTQVETFRVGCIGALTPHDLDQVVHAVGATLRQLGLAPAA